MVLHLAYLMILPTIILLLSLVTHQTKQHRLLILIEYVVLLIVQSVMNYLTLPSLTITNVLLVNLTFGLILLALISVSPDFKNRRLVASTGFKSLSFKISIVISGIIFLVLAVTIGASQFISGSIANDVNTSTNQSSAPFPVINTKTETPIVNSKLTVKAQVNNNLGQVPHSNVYNVNTTRVQIQHKKAIYVSDLDFTGNYFTYRTNGAATPGYFTTDADSKAAKPTFIKIKMKYTPNAYLGKNANRRLTAALPFGYGMDKPEFEIDGHNHPYYVSTLTKHYGLWANKKYSQYKYAVLDAVTGKVKIYTTSTLPKWVDVAVDAQTAEESLAVWGKYRNGWLNQSIFGSKSNIFKGTAAGVLGDNKTLTPIVYKNTLYYYSSLSSYKKNQKSILGHAFINARTGKISHYTESASLMTGTRAKSIAESQMKQTKWEAENPLLYMIDNQPTWIVSMIDPDNKVFQQYVYINAGDNGNTLATGNTASVALSNYRTVLSDDGVVTTDKKSTKQVSGKISRISRVITDGKITFMLEGSMRTYTVDSNDFAMAGFINEGDDVDLNVNTYNNSNTVTKFSDHALTK